MKGSRCYMKASDCCGAKQGTWIQRKEKKIYEIFAFQWNKG